MRSRTLPIWVLQAVLCCVLAIPSMAQNPRKKLIEVGWDAPSTAFLKEHHEQMQAEAPFDGVMFKVELKTPEGKRLSTDWGWDKVPWKREWLKPALEDLKACTFTRFTDNFLRFNCSPGTMNWGDDVGWEILAEKLAISAWLVKEGGGKGLILDPESYGEKQYRFDPAKGRSFVQTCQLARRRGAQVMKAIAGEFPNAVILAFWLNSCNFNAGCQTDPDAVLAGADDYGLLPAFVNGMLDAMPGTLTLIDGCENGYYMDGELEYQRAANDMRSWQGPALRLVAPENRAKYRAQVQAGFGFYLDMFLNEEGNRYYFGPKPGGTRLDHLRDNLTAARAASDEYVWIYGEQCRWWKSMKAEQLGGSGQLNKTVGKGRLWEEAMPGITATIWRIRDPLAYARGRLETLKRENSLQNFAKNADLSTKAEGSDLPIAFGSWQEEGSKGSFAWDGQVGGGSARASGVKGGCFIQKIPAKEQETYLVEAQVKLAGAGTATLMVRWQRSDGTWVRWSEDRTFTFEGNGEWKKAAGVVTVPREAGHLVVLLNAGQELSQEDIAWFDNIGIWKLD